MGGIQTIQRFAEVRVRGRLHGLLILPAIGLLLNACAMTYPTRNVTYNEVALDRPALTPQESELLGVRLEAFNPGTLPDEENLSKGLSLDIRNAESYYISVQLKNTMQRSGHWGPVRVVPKGARNGEVIVSGKILESDGEVLKLAITVGDASGAQWFTKEYESVIDEEIYRKAENQNIDAYQHLYNEIANDIAKYEKRPRAKDAAAVREVAALRFSAEFAPEHFSGYLQAPTSDSSSQREESTVDQLVSFFYTPPDGQDNKYAVLRLPSKEDPLVQRIYKLRAREEFLIDTLDQQYDDLARNISDPYTQWRRARLREINAVRESDRIKNEEQSKAVAIAVLGTLAGAAVASTRNCYSCGTAGAVIAGAAVAVGVQKAIQASERAEADTKLRKAALEELGQSLVADVKPVIVEVEGETVELTGTVEQKFERWREVLRDLRNREVGPALPTSPAKTS